MHKTLIAALAGALACFFPNAYAQSGIAPKTFEPAFAQWVLHGETNLFSITNSAAAVRWDSSKTNSYFYYPLGITLTRSDTFTLTFVMQVNELTIGTTPGKPYTFQIAAGLINLTNAFDPEMFRATGIDPEHGPRNLVEFNYFPDSGFGATVAPTIVTAENQIGFSGNYPMEIELGAFYKIEMAHDAADRTLRSRMWKGAVVDGAIRYGTNAVPLKDIVLTQEFSDFGVNAIAIASYSDAGQTPPYEGSISGSGIVPELNLVVYNRPLLEISQSAGTLQLSFETASNWKYFVESTTNMLNWESAAGPIAGSGNRVSVPVPGLIIRHQLFRIRGERD